MRNPFDGESKGFFLFGDHPAFYCRLFQYRVRNDLLIHRETQTMKYLYSFLPILLVALWPSSLSAQGYRDIAWVNGGIESPIGGVAVYADGTRLVAGGSDLVVWDLTRRTVVMKVFTDYVQTAVAVTPDDRYIASAGGTLTLWDASTLKPVRDYDQSGDLTSIAISHDGQYIAGGDRAGLVKVWNLASGQLLATFEGHTKMVNHVVFSSIGDTIASVGSDAQVMLWRVSTRELLVTLKYYEAVAFSPDGRYMALEEDNYNQAWIINLHDTTERWKMFDPNGEEWDLVNAQFFAFSPDSKYLVGVDLGAEVWDVQTGKHLAYLDASSWLNFEALAFSGDGRNIYAADFRGSIAQWETTTWSFVDFLTDFPFGVSRVEFSPDGTLLAVGTLYWVYVYDAATAKRMAKLPCGFINDMYRLAFSSDGRYLAAGGADARIRIWEVGVWGDPRILYEYDAGISALAFSPDGKYLASARNGAVNLWDLGADTLLHQWGWDSAALSLKFSPNGQYLASASAPGMVALWDVARRQRAGTLSGGHTATVFDIAYSPDGRRIVSGGHDGRVILWDVESGQKLREYQHGALVTGVGFASGGRTVLSGSFDGTIMVHDADTWDSLYSYAEYPSRVTSMAVSPHGDYVAMGADDALVMYYGRWKGAGAVPGERPAMLNAGAVLYQNVPNPFTEETTIRYTLPESGEVWLYITDALGNVVREVEQGRRNAGEHSVIVSAASLGSGPYFYHVESGGRRSTRQMMVVR
jgi:WD40 repeat protein